MIDKQLELVKVLGKGGSSKVFLAKDALNNKYAIKVIRKDKASLQHSGDMVLKREHELLQQLDGHPNVIKSLYVNYQGVLESGNESESIMYLALEYARHGTLSSFIKHTGCLEEEVARFYALQLWHAVWYLHSLGYAHLDIKLENVLLDDLFNIKLADMGSSIKVLETNGLTDRRRGTVMYMAPEVVSLKFNESFDAWAADIYSLGVTLSLLMSGVFPSADKLSMSTVDSDKTHTIHSDKSAKRYSHAFTEEAKILIQSMTNSDPAKRPTMDEVLSSSWLCKKFPNNSMAEEVYNEMNWRNDYISNIQLQTEEY